MFAAPSFSPKSSPQVLYASVNPEIYKEWEHVFACSKAIKILEMFCSSERPESPRHVSSPSPLFEWIQRVIQNAQWIQECLWRCGKFFLPSTWRCSIVSRVSQWASVQGVHILRGLSSFFISTFNLCVFHQKLARGYTCCRIGYAIPVCPSRLLLLFS